MNKSRLQLQNENMEDRISVKINKSNFQSNSKPNRSSRRMKKSNKKKQVKNRATSQVKYEYKESRFKELN